MTGVQTCALPISFEGQLEIDAGRREVDQQPCVIERQMLVTALAKQQTYIQSIAVDELKAQRDRLNTYMVQARFALASMYDRASARTTPESNRVLGEAAR